MKTNRLFALLLPALLSAPAWGANIIYGTGVGKDPITAGASQRDDYWNVVAVAADFTIPDSQSTPYSAYVPYWVSFNFFGGQSPVWGGNNGYTVGDETYYWISPYTTADFAPASTQWSFIVAQEFTITVPGLYAFDFGANGDNSLAFFIDGQVDSSSSNNPTITSGTQIGTAQGGDLGRLYQYTGTVYLEAGTHTAYAVVVDTGYQTGAFITNSTFELVPEPSAMLLGVTGGAFVIFRRRRAR